MDRMGEDVKRSSWLVQLGLIVIYILSRHWLNRLFLFIASPLLGGNRRRAFVVRDLFCHFLCPWKREKRASSRLPWW